MTDTVTDTVTNELADALEDMLTIAGWIPREVEDDCGADVACWKARRALHNLREASGRDPYCMDDRDDPPAGVSYDLKIQRPTGLVSLPAPEASQPEAHPDVRVVASECDLYGHDYQVRESDLGDGSLRQREPWQVFCSRCGLSWKVER